MAWDISVRLETGYGGMGDGSWVETRRRGEGVAHLLTTLIAPTTNPNTTHTTDLFLFPFSSPHTHTLSICLFVPHAATATTSSLSLWFHLLDGWLLLLLLLAAACQVACRQTKSSLTLQSLYIYGVPNGPVPPRLFLPLTPFQATPLRGTRTPILIVARTLFTGKAAAAGTIPTG